MQTPPSEADFHDEWAENIDPTEIDIQTFFEGATSPENRFLVQHLGEVKGKQFLELGCGAGEASVYFATRNACCTATDNSPGMLQVVGKLAAKYGVTVKRKLMNAEAIAFPDNSFDIVYAANLLHHVNPTTTLREMHRVLRPGGMACCWDPLRHNPIINIYRRMADQVRTKNEHPLDIKIVKEIEGLFARVSWDTFWLATLWIFLRFYLIERIHPNQERYWKKIIREEPRLRPSYNRLEKLDRLLKKIPATKRFAWNLAFVATK
ncbi:MAG: methyltransferase domain-containing protein [Planctomycetes bacterium]|nr:methyltransferase domain-containing protein [Planctomycetota bacterium]